MPITSPERERSGTLVVETQRDVAVLPELALLEADDRLARAHDLQLGRARTLRVRGVEEVGVAAPEGLRDVVDAEPAHQRLADPREPALHVLEVHVVGCVLEKGLEQVPSVHLCLDRQALSHIQWDRRLGAVA